jgi:hypothetical protein
MNAEQDFYIGYLPKAPPGLRRFLRRAIFGIGLVAVVLAFVFAFAQMPFAKSYFDFGKLRNFEGTLTTEPYPILLVTRPGQAASNARTSEYLLVAPGKHGADDLIRNFVGKEVGLRGQLIYRDEKTMLEIEPGSIRELNIGGTDKLPAQDLGPLSVIGEIVDSKCDLGVMNPGRGKVHRDCASRCLSGGTPPLFIEFATGKAFVLVAADGGALSYNEIRQIVAEPLTISGEHTQRGEEEILSIDPRQLRHFD